MRSNVSLGSLWSVPFHCIPPKEVNRVSPLAQVKPLKNDWLDRTSGSCCLDAWTGLYREALRELELRGSTQI
jgi:hypothetical protein